MTSPAIRVWPPAIRVWREQLGFPHSYYELPKKMPRIPDSHLQCVAFLYESKEAASRGVAVGGTGFVATYPIDSVPLPNGQQLNRRYLITNQHVLDMGGYWVRLNRPGGFHIMEIPEIAWTRSPWDDDWAVAPLGLPSEVTPFALSLENYAATRQVSEELRIGPGDEVYMVGRFVAHGGRLTNNPIARFGFVSLMPDPAEPVEDGRYKQVEAYLVEMRSHAGFSGSPVFVVIGPNSFRGDLEGKEVGDNKLRFRLLGIDTGHKTERLQVDKYACGRWVKDDEHRVLHNRDIAIVAPIWKVVDLLEREDFVQEREKEGRAFLAQHENELAVADSTESDDAAPDEYQRFEDLTRQLVNTPKPKDQ